MLNRMTKRMIKSMEKDFGPIFTQMIVFGAHQSLVHYFRNVVKGDMMNLRSLRFTVNDFFDFEVFPEIKVNGERPCESAGQSSEPTV